MTESIFLARVSPALLLEHVARSMSNLKKILLVLGAVVLGPVLLIGLVALAAGDWHAVGETSRGDKVSVSSLRILKNNMRSAWVRVEFKEPASLPQGGPFVEMRARVRFNCKSGSSIPSDEWFYSRDRSGKLPLLCGKRESPSAGSIRLTSGGPARRGSG